MSNYITYPHGFRSLSSRDKDDAGVFVYDRDIENIYRSYINHEIDFNNWNYRVQVIEECFRLFGQNFEEWVLYQINKNTLVYDHSLEFIIDTLNFITGKQRTTSIFVWRELMLTNPEHKSNIEISTRRINKLRDLHPRIPSQTSEIVQLWCSQPDGFEDLITSLFLFFGPSININNKTIQNTNIK